MEAILLSGLGGVLGVLLGTLVSELLARYAGWPVHLPYRAMLYAFSFSLAVGVFFGYYPARKAAQLNPIEALRYE